MHRIGQDRTVYVKHFIVSKININLLSPSYSLNNYHLQIAKTIENRILQIQKRKAAIVNEAFRGSGKADPESIQNLKIMFGDD